MRYVVGIVRDAILLFAIVLVLIVVMSGVPV